MVSRCGYSWGWAQGCAEGEGVFYPNPPTVQDEVNETHGLLHIFRSSL